MSFPLGGYPSFPAAGSAYATNTEVKAAMPDVISGATYDTILATLATRASRLIDGLFGYEDNAFVAPSSATARYYNGTGAHYVYIDPCTSITEVAVKPNETAATYDAWTVTTDYELAAGGVQDPVWNAGYYTLLVVAPGIAKAFTAGRKTVRVTMKYGRTATPPDVIVQATIVQAGRWFKRGQGAFQDAQGSNEMGQLIYTKALDPDIKEILLASGYKRGGL
jgi:hypothetical protein